MRMLILTHENDAHFEQNIWPSENYNVRCVKVIHNSKLKILIIGGIKKSCCALFYTFKQENINFAIFFLFFFFQIKMNYIKS